MVRRGLVLVLLAGCSQLLGLSQPHEQGDALGGDAGETADFTIRVTTIAPRVPQNSFDFVDVSVTRGNGFTGAITVDVPAPPAGVTVAPVTIPDGSDTGRLKLSGAAGLTVGATLSLDLVAKGGGLQHDVKVDALVTLQPGTLDPGYGPDGNGIVKVLFAAEPDAHGFFTDGMPGPAGSVIAVGCAELITPGVRGLIERITPGGRLDTAFATNGLTLATPDPASNVFVQLQAGTRLSSGGVAAAGEGHDPVGPAQGVAWDTAFQANGQFDDEFGNDLDDARPQARGIVALSDDSLVIVEGTVGTTDYQLVKRTSFGAIDATFNGGAPLALGFEYAKNQGIGGAGGIAPDLAGKTFYVGGLGATGVVVHVKANGSFDNAFGSGGIAALGDGSSAAIALAVQADGKLVVGVQASNVARLTADGALDPSFGGNGSVSLGAVTPFSVTSVALQGDGKILVGGGNGTGGVVVFRLLPDGTPDASFGDNGIAFVGQFSLSRLVVADDGGIVGVGLDTAGEPLAPGAFRLAP